MPQKHITQLWDDQHVYTIQQSLWTERKLTEILKSKQIMPARPPTLTIALSTASLHPPMLCYILSCQSSDQIVSAEERIIIIIIIIIITATL